MLKYFVKLFVITFLFFVSTNVYSNEITQIKYIDLKVVLNESKAGEKAQTYLKKTAQNDIKRFKKIEEELQEKEKELIEKKNVIDKEEYGKMANDLREKVRAYQKDRNDSLQKIATQRAKARSKLVETLKPILEKYSKENNISVILNKKDTLFATPELDITKPIIDILNKNLPSIDLK